MSQEKERHDLQGAPDTPEHADTPEKGQTEAQNAAPRDELAEIKALADGLKDRLLRQMAEMENLRKRTEREKAEGARYAIARFARDIVTVADDLHRALASVPDGAKKEIEAVRNLVEGVAVTERQLMQIFERHGLKRFDPTGDRFDPELHEAMFEIPDPSQPAGTVAQVIEAGYMIGDRMLRPARVGIARGGPKPGAVEPADDTGPPAETPATAPMDANPAPPASPASPTSPASPAGIGKKIDTSA
ncbi:MAG: nucleotide exchange factor GrpE [Alphaproteobacteria bacterium]